MSGHQVVPVRVYLAVFTALMVLTGVTVAVAFIDLGKLNIVVAIAIAVLKATLVVLYFMHVRYSSGLVKVFVAAGFLWLLILLALTSGDYMSRDWSGGAPKGWGAPSGY